MWSIACVFPLRKGWVQLRNNKIRTCCLSWNLNSSFKGYEVWSFVAYRCRRFLQLKSRWDPPKNWDPLLWGIGISPCSPSSQLHGCLRYSTVPLRHLKFSSTKEGLVKNLGFEGTTRELKHHLKYLMSRRSMLMTWRLKIWVLKGTADLRMLCIQIVHVRSFSGVNDFEHFWAIPTWRKSSRNGICSDCVQKS